MMYVGNDMRTAGIQRAAILVASLDEATADLLLEQLDPECADLVRRTVIDVDEISCEQRQRILDDFRRIQMMVPGQFPAGIDLERPVGQTLSRVLSDNKEPMFLSAIVAQVPAGPALPTATGRGAEESPSSPFGFLREAEEAQLARLLSGERPQAVALVLSHLAPPQAGAVLARLTPPVQAEVMRRLVELDNTDAETIRNVEQALEARLLRLFANEPGCAAGRDTVASILAACDSSLADTILDNLAEIDEPLAERLGRRPLEFDDLAEFDDTALLAVFRAAEPEVAQAALLGAAPQLVERILRRMLPREAKILRRKLDRPAPIRLSDLEDARRQIAEIARHRLRSRQRPAAAA